MTIRQLLEKLMSFEKTNLDMEIIVSNEHDYKILDVEVYNSVCCFVIED